MSDLPPLRLIAFVSDFPPEEEIEGGEAVRPYELFRWAGEAGLPGRVWCIRPPRRRHAQLGTISVRTIPFARVGALREALLPIILRVLFLIEARAAARDHRRLVLYQRVPGGVTFKWGRIPIDTEPGWKLFRLAHRLHALVWASMHDLSPDHEFSIARRNDYTPERARLVRRAGVRNERCQARSLRSADLITVVSAGMQDEVLQRYRIDPERLHILWAGVREELVDVPFRPRDGVRRVGYIGAASDADLATLVEATATLDGVELVIAGRRSPGRWRNLDVHHVRAVAHTRYADFPTIAKEIDIWVVPLGTDPYFQLAWPLKLPMYLATNRPVVVTRTAEVMRSQWRNDLIITDPAVNALRAGIQRALLRGSVTKSEHVQPSWTHQFSTTIVRLVELLDGSGRPSVAAMSATAPRVDEFTVAVAIPTWQRPTQLRSCLRGLVTQLRKPDEVIVIRRGSDDAALKVAVEFANELPKLRVLQVEEPGHMPPILCAVRNAASTHIAFLDDDAVPSREWLDELTAPFLDRSVACVGGRIVDPFASPAVARDAGRIRWYGKFVANVGYSAGDRRRVAGVMEGNSCWRLDVLERLRFDSSLNRHAAPFYGLDLTLQASSLGFKVVQTPRALVHHNPGRRDDAYARDSAAARTVYTINYTRILWRHLPVAKRALFVCWSLLFGERASYGIIKAIADCVTRRQVAPLRQCKRDLLDKLGAIHTELRAHESSRHRRSLDPFRSNPNGVG